MQEKEWIHETFVKHPSKFNLCFFFTIFLFVLKFVILFPSFSAFRFRAFQFSSSILVPYWCWRSSMYRYYYTYDKKCLESLHRFGCRTLSKPWLLFVTPHFLEKKKDVVWYWNKSIPLLVNIFWSKRPNNGSFWFHTFKYFLAPLLILNVMLRKCFIFLLF